MNIRLLKSNEIDVRVGSINEKGASLLLYKDARVDMNILDESGVKWKRSHELINGNLFCTISVWDEDIKEWISRQDVGTESQAEKEKGQASDAFKRAGFNFGIGRELYTAPFIWVNASSIELRQSSFNGKTKYSTYDKFYVSDIGYNENKEINKLVIKNQKTHKVVFTLGSDTNTQKEEPSTKVSGFYVKRIRELGKQHEYKEDALEARIASLNNNEEAKAAIKLMEETLKAKEETDSVPFED